MLWGMHPQTTISLASLPPVPLSPRVYLVVTQDRAHHEITELIVRLALHGSFHLIAGGEWLPDQDTLRRSVRSHTVNVTETLDHLSLGRPSTCLQLRDQLAQADEQNHLILILDFLHLFYDSDVDLSLRQRVLEQCCRSVQHLSKSKLVIALVQQVPVQDYELFFPTLASVADEILEAQADPKLPVSQPSLF